MKTDSKERRIGTSLALLGLLAALFAANPLEAGPEAPEGNRASPAALLRHGDLAGLEARLNGLLRAYEDGRGTESAVAAAFRSFESADPALEGALGRWIEAHPASFAARLARGAYHRHLGWVTRLGGEPRRPGQAPPSLSTDHFGRAWADLHVATALRPRLGIAHGLLIDLAMAAGDTASADRLAQAGLAADPRSGAVRRAYLRALRPWWRAEMDPGEVLSDLETFVAEVAEDSRDLPALAPLSGFTAFVTAELLRRQRRHSKARAYYEEALAFGDDWEYLRQSGANAYAIEDYADALELFDRALAARPDDPILLDWRARAHWALDRRDDAERDWTRALALDPWNPAILLPRAEAARSMGRLAEAAEALDRALVYGGEDSRVRTARGRFQLAALGRPDQALPDLALAIRLDPGDETAWQAYARTLDALGTCDAWKALGSYRNLCRNGVRCAAEDLDWAEAAWRHYQDPLVCPAFGMLGP